MVYTVLNNNNYAVKICSIYTHKTKVSHQAKLTCIPIIILLNVSQTRSNTMTTWEMHTDIILTCVATQHTSISNIVLLSLSWMVGRACTKVIVVQGSVHNMNCPDTRMRTK